jgi:hypothetical protein
LFQSTGNQKSKLNLKEQNVLPSGKVLPLVNHRNLQKPISVTLEGLLGGPGTILSKIIPPTESVYREINQNLLRKHYESKNLPGI